MSLTGRAGLAAATVSLMLLSGTAAAKPEQLSPHAFRKLVDRTRGALARVVQPAGPAVLIGVGGELLAPATLVKGDSVQVEHAGERREARVVRREAELGVVLLAIEPGAYPAATVGEAAALQPGAVLLGLWLDGRGQLASRTGHLAKGKAREGRLRNDVPGPPGTALFNSRGELVGMHVRGGTLSIDALRARLAAARSE